MNSLGDKAAVEDQCSASIGHNPSIADGLTGKGVYSVECIGPKKGFQAQYIQLRDLRDAANDAGNDAEVIRISALMKPMEEIKWTDTIVNKTPTGGLDDILDNYWAGAAYTAAFYCGLINATPTYAAGDTMASHAGWTENTNYNEATRPAPTFGAASGGVKATSSAMTFSINTNAQTIAGCLISTNSTKGGATGVLVSAGSFTLGDKGVNNGDTLNVSYSYTAASTN